MFNPQEKNKDNYKEADDRKEVKGVKVYHFNFLLERI